MPLAFMQEDCLVVISEITSLFNLMKLVYFKPQKENWLQKDTSNMHYSYSYLISIRTTQCVEKLVC